MLDRIAIEGALAHYLLPPDLVTAITEDLEALLQPYDAAVRDLVVAVEGILEDDGSQTSLAVQRARWPERMRAAQTAVDAVRKGCADQGETG